MLSPTRRLIAATVTAVLGAGVLAVPPAQATTRPAHPSVRPEKLDSIGGPAKQKALPTKAAKTAEWAAPVWPAPGRARAALLAATARTAAVTTARAGSLPVRVTRAATVSGRAVTGVDVEVHDRGKSPSAWRNGLLLTVRPEGAAGPADVDVTVDYKPFRHAYGGNWSSRLALWALPSCALTTPAAPECPAVQLKSVNSVLDGTVSARVSAAPAGTVMALAAGPAGVQGDYAATPLAASATWSSGGSTGNFTWSYDMRVPPAAGLAPKVSLSYSSSAVDGRSSAENSQPSWVGEGFDYSPGFIERSYVPCSEDMAGTANNTVKTGDLCWRSDNATMSLSGGGSELVFEAGKGWHSRDEDGAKIEKLPGASNGADGGEHWKVTATDGTQYFFGLNNPPGQSTATNSTWTVPVAGNHTNEPCNGGTFAASFCTQAWRWNLDYVVDPRGNTMSYWYTPETNRYGKNLKATDKAVYTRGGTLSRIDYGTWDRSGSRSITPTGQVVFTALDRCESNCTNHSPGVSWKDVPWDQECTSGAANCGTNYTPTFWSTKRLAKVTTRVWDTTKTTPAWQDVDSWAFTHTYPPVGDGSDYAGMWLTSIVHTGLVSNTTATGSTATTPDNLPPVVIPPVTFEPTSLQNRVLASHNTTNNRNRIGNIITETGSKIQVTYSLPECTSSNLPSAPETNTKLCYPVIGPDPYAPDGPDIREWWHKYVVRQVSQSDIPSLVDGVDYQAPVQNTFYDYLGDPAWHYADDDGLIKPKRKTWSQFRGYRTVETRTGDAPRQTLTRTTYLQGMHGDRLNASGGSRTVTIGASLGSETVYDEDQFAGMIREKVVYNGTTTKPVNKTVNVPWRSPETASRTINGDTVTARFVNTTTTYQARSLGVDGQGGWDTIRTQSKFDDTYGTLTWTQDDGEYPTTGDEQCTKLTYNRNTGANIIGAVKRATTTALTCGSNPTSADEVISDTRTTYDGAASPDTQPSYGSVTKVEELKDWSSAAGTVWQTTAQSTYDASGRVATVTDVRGNTTTTIYTPATGPVASINTTSPDPNGGAAWSTTVTAAPYWGAPVKTTDPNSRVKDSTYDPLGRVSKVWAVGWDRKNRESIPSVAYAYSYAPNRNAYPWVQTKTVNAGNGILTTYQIFDALLRPRQTQSTGANGDRVIADTIYDKIGRVDATYAAHGKVGAPSGTLWGQPDWSVPTVTRIVYDDASRPTASILLGTDGVTNQVEKWRTTTTYLGDRTSGTPPAGGTPTTTVTDIRGRTVELRQHTTDQGVAGAYQSTRYTYNRKGQLVAVADPDENQWTYTFDVKGRQISAKDPDKGTTTSTYSDTDDLATTTDARGEVLAYEYDNLGRKIGLYDDTISAATKRASWKFDKTDIMFGGEAVRGQLTEATRFDPPGSTNAYKIRYLAWTKRYQPGAVQYVIPATETGLNTTWEIGYGYREQDGSPSSVTMPVAGDLTGSETITTNYDATSGLPVTLTTGSAYGNSYVIGQQYTASGEPTLLTRKSSAGNYVEETNTYDLTTRRLHNTYVKPETAAGRVSDRTYDYDDAGNITSIADQPAVGQTDIQCFHQDPLGRLTSAWTPKVGVDCKTAPTTANLGGPAPYWHDWTFDKVGNRLTETAHTSAGDTKRTYTVPTGGQNVVRPHAATAVTTEAPGQPDVTNAYAYDNTGNTTCRPAGTATNTCPPGSTSQNLSWDAEGRLTSISGDAPTAGSNIYGADGNRLLRRDATGTTLYLPGMEIRWNGTSRNTTRYYTFGGRLIASRTASALTWLFTDHQGTQHATVSNSGAQTVTRRYQTPYGNPRGSQVPWANPRGFVGGDNDPSGLIHLGAREYDPGLGRFISVDPLQNLSDPQQWHGYSYSSNSPITRSDPTGLIDADCLTISSCPDYQMGNEKGNSANKAKNPNCWPRCSGTENPKRSKPPTINDIRAGRFPIPDKYKKILKAKGYEGSDLFTVGEVTDWAAQSRENYVLICSEVLGGDPLVCDVQNPLLPKRSAVQDVILIGLIVGAVVCPFCLAEAAIAEGEFAATGAIIGGSGLGALRPFLAGERAAGALALCSFSGDTKVLMADGTTKPISEIKVGDAVKAADPQTGAKGGKPVTNLWIHQDSLREIVIGGETLTTTEDHPFWNATDQKWVRADELKPGDLLRTPDGPGIAVDKISPTAVRTDRAYNLTVVDIHTYYVLAGQTPVLVHNSGSWCEVGPAEAQGIIQNAKGYGSGLKRDAGHIAADFVVGDIATRGVTTRLVGGDGVERLLVQMPGEMNGKAGRFEWIVERGGSGNMITHQRFVNGGSMNGIPNKP
ncbi:polymorphic toxin-type HINT domain-containing protein [Micromonospora rubida]|uniref:Polymorphic toxin-type HINT domain-containing protein n=1 Tax=Micromonospora rubida TaxID=2697657 RepID=A0ABW7STZ2_9ACTN